MSLPLFDYATIPPEERALIERTFTSFTTLAQVLDWGRDVDPAVAVDEIITQDEYTHDVLIGLPNSRYLNFDTT